MADSRDGALAGAGDAIRKLQALGALDNGKIMLGAVRAGMNEVLKPAQDAAPVGTRSHKTYKGNQVSPGFAKRSLHIVVSTKNKSGRPAAALLSTSKEGYYAVQFIERGTSKIKAQPWLRPAFFNSQEAQKRAVVAYLQKRLAKIAKDGKP